MSSVAISLDNIGKAYKIGLAAEKHDTFRDMLAGMVKAPFQRFRMLGEKRTERDEFWALRNISFEVPRGEVMGIIGRNGAGKSTLLKVLSRITEPTEGCARLRGRVASLLEVGTGFHPELTGRENIYLNGAILGMKKSEIDRKFDQIIAFAEVQKFLDTPVKRYSSGMYVRLAFAVAAHLEPEILIVDEVLAVGDAEFQKKCLGKMQEVATGQGRTVLFVSHNMGAVRRLCRSAVYLDRGSVAAIGHTDEIVDQYLSRLTAAEVDPDLRHRPRSSRLRPTITRFRCVPEDGSDRITPGGTVVFEVEYESGQRMPNAALNILIDSDQGERVLGFNTRLELGMVNLEAGRRTVRCRVEDFPLMPGHYSVDLVLWCNGPMLDLVEKAAMIDVKFADYFGTNEMPNAGQGKVLKRSRWEI